MKKICDDIQKNEKNWKVQVYNPSTTQSIDVHTNYSLTQTNEWNYKCIPSE